MALMLYLDDAMKVLLQNDFIDIGYIDEDGGSELVRNELEQKCYLREPVELVKCKDCKYGHPLIYRGYTECTRVSHIGERHGNDWFCADAEKKGD